MVLREPPTAQHTEPNHTPRFHTTSHARHDTFHAHTFVASLTASKATANGRTPQHLKRKTGNGRRWCALSLRTALMERRSGSATSAVVALAVPAAGSGGCDNGHERDGRQRGSCHGGCERRRWRVSSVASACAYRPAAMCCVERISSNAVRSWSRRSARALRISRIHLRMV